jgi:hypothetical protein
MFDNDEKKSNKRIKRFAKDRIIENALIEMKKHKNHRFEKKKITRRELFETKQRQRQQHHETLMLQKKKRLLQSRETLLRLRITLNISRDMKKNEIIKNRKIEIIENDTDENEIDSSENDEIIDEN